MTKPVTGLTAFAGLAPPWNLSQLDADIAALQAALNDLGTYSNPFTDSGAANAITIALPANLTCTLAVGLLLYVKVLNTTTSATVTLTMTSVFAATNVKLPSGANPGIGTLIAGGVYAFYYDGTNFQVVSAPSIVTGTFTGTLSGMTGTVSGTCKYQIIGNLVTVFIPAMAGTSNATTMTMTGVPAAIQPTTGKAVPIAPTVLVNNGSAPTTTADVFIGAGIGTWTFCLAGALPGIFVASGSKGTSLSTTICYTLD